MSAAAGGSAMRSAVSSPVPPIGSPWGSYSNGSLNNWVAPIALSPEDPKTVYAGAQVLFRSKDRGDTWEEISPDLTTNDPEKIGKNVPYCTITTISESPLKAGVIWQNTYNKFDPTAAFGGYKESGFGREGGAAGLRPYLRVT